MQAPKTLYPGHSSAGRLGLAEMTDPRRDLINLAAVLPQVNHRRSNHVQRVESIMKKNRSTNDISNLYPSMYAKNQHGKLTSHLSN